MQTPIMNDDTDAAEETDPIKEKEVYKNLSEEMKKRYDILYESDSNPPISVIGEMIDKYSGGTSNNDAPKKTVSMMSKYFIAELVYEAMTFREKGELLTPEHIMLGFYNMEKNGKIPGLDQGNKRTFLRKV